LEVVRDVIKKRELLGINDRLREDCENFVSKRFTTSQIHVLCANFVKFVKFGRPEISKVVRYLADKKKQKKSARSRFYVDRAQNLSGPVANNVLTVPKFHPNRFSSGGVIAERVNTVQICHKVFPILGESSASSPSN